MLEKNLLELGFTPNETKVYISLLQLGQTKVGPLLSKTGFHRNIVYRALDNLINIKLANKITKRGVSYFSPIDPEAILFEQKKRERIAKNAIKEIRQIKQQSFSEVMVLTGKQGIMDLCEMLIKEKADNYVIGGTFNILKSLEEKAEYFQERINKASIKHYTLAQANMKNNIKLNIQNQTKYLPKNIPPSPHVIWVFGQITAQILWEDPQTIFVIKNIKVADSYREYFNLMWKNAKK